MIQALLAVNDGLIGGEADAADFLFLVAAVLFGVVTFLHFSAKAVESALTTLAFTLVAVALLVL